MEVLWLVTKVFSTKFRDRTHFGGAIGSTSKQLVAPASNWQHQQAIGSTSEQSIGSTSEQSIGSTSEQSAEVFSCEILILVRVRVGVREFPPILQKFSPTKVSQITLYDGYTSFMSTCTLHHQKHPSPSKWLRNQVL